MRNLKRALSLALAAVMVIGMMVIGAGAVNAKDFTDADEITNTDAVSTMVALGIINGKEDGSYFDPTGSVTRAEMAKMICVAINSGVDPVLGTKDKPTFTDIKGHWAESYIEFCATSGIIAGRGNGKFDPAGTVTATEAAKMLLGVLGYDAKVSGLVGGDWALKTNVLANQNGLYKKLADLTATTTMNRDNAAQMIYNALDAKMVELKDNGIDYATSQYSYTGTETVITGSERVWKLTIIDTTGLEAGNTVASLDKTIYSNRSDAIDALKAANKGTAVTDDGTKFSLEQKTQDITGTNKVTKYADETMGHKYLSLITDGDGILTGVEKDTKGTYSLYIDFSSKPVYTKVASDYSELVGQKVKVLFKDTDKVYGVYANTESAVLANSVAGKVSITGTTLKIDGKVYKTDKAFNQTPVYDFNTNTSVMLDTFASAVNGGTTNKAAAVRAIDNDDNGKIDLFVLYPFTVQKVNYVSKTSVTLSGAGANDLEDINYYEGIAKDDYVKVTAAANTAENKLAVEKIDTVSGTVNGVKSNSIKVNDEWFDAVGTSKLNVEGYALGDTVEVVAVNGYYFNVKISDSASTELVYITANNLKDNVTGTATAKAYFTDGTSATIQVKKVDGSTSIAANALQSKMFTYSVKDNEYTLKSVSNGNLAGYTYYGSGTTAGLTAKTGSDEAKLGGVLFADSAVVFVEKSDKSVSVLKGADAQKLGTLTTNVYSYLSKAYNGFTKIGAAAMKVTESSIGIKGDIDFGYVVADSVKTKNGDDYFMEMSIQTADGILNVKAEVASGDSESAAGFTRGSFISFKTLSNGNIDSVTNLTTTGNTVGAGAITATDSKNLTVMGAIEYASNKLVDDSKIVYINSEDRAAAEGGSIQLATETATDGVYFYNVFVVDGSASGVGGTAGEVAAIFVDVNNKLTPDKGVSYPTTDTRVNVAATIVAPDDSISNATVGNFTAAVSPNGDVKPGTTVTVTVTWDGTVAITGQGVTVTVKDGSTVLGAVTFDAASTGTAVSKTVTFKCPEAAPSFDLTIADVPNP